MQLRRQSNDVREPRGGSHRSIGRAHLCEYLPERVSMAARWRGGWAEGGRGGERQYRLSRRRAARDAV